MEKVFRLVCVGIVGLLLSSGRAGAQDIEYSRATLRGLAGVRVLVENIDQDAQADGLTQQQLQTAVELQLRKEGIPVLSMTQMPGTPYLYVTVTAHKDQRRSFYHYCFRVELHQEVLLARAPDIRAFATTWSLGGIAGIGSEALSGAVRANILNYVEQFIHAYLSENPK